MKTDKLKNKSKAELEKTILEKRERLRILRFSLAAGKLKNVGEFQKTKKDIARILTLLNIKSGKKETAEKNK